MPLGLTDWSKGVLIYFSSQCQLATILFFLQPGKPNLKRRSEEEEDVAYEEQEVRPRKDRHREVSQNSAQEISNLTEEQQEQINKIVDQEPEVYCSQYGWFSTLTSPKHCSLNLPKIFKKPY